MKTRVFWGSLVLVSALLILNSCSKDNPAPDPIVGVWLRDYYSFSNVPATFSRFTGFYIPNPNVTSGLFGEDSYTLTVNNDKSYNIVLAYPGPDSTDAGKWTKDAKTLTLTSNTTGVPANQYSLEQDVTTSKLVMSNTETFFLLPDAIVNNDTITAWSQNGGFYTSKYAQYYQDVDIKVTYYFNKK